jgi:cytochrome c553
MIKIILKWIGIILAGILGLLVLAAITLYIVTEQQLNKVYEVPPSGLVIPSNPATIARGKHLVDSFGLCAGCHTENFGGESFNEGMLIGTISTANLTSGKGGIGSVFTDEDWVRAIRHGLNPEGKTLINMPSNAFYHLSDEDLVAIIAYLKTVPPVDHEIPKTSLGLMARYFILLTPDLLPAQAIDHKGPRPVAPQPGVSVEYGEYLALACKACHGQDLAGGTQPGEGLNLTPAGDLGQWTEADFLTALRTGTTPDGKALNPDLMPWQMIGKMTDDELKAIWLYFQTVPPVEVTPQPPQSS